MREENFYLKTRTGRWYYYRAVPTYARSVDERVNVRWSLRAKAVVLVRRRRDLLVAADNEYWSALLTIDAEKTLDGERGELRGRVARRYQAARVRALATELDHAPLDRLLHELALNPSLAGDIGLAGRDAQPAVAARRPMRISEAFEVFCEQIALRDIASKSRNQKRAWRLSKSRSIRELIDVVGDKPIDDLSRSDAQKFHNWWARRLQPKVGGRELSANTANRSLCNVRKFYGDYFAYFGDEGRMNPFRLLNFAETTRQAVFPFDDEWVRANMLRVGVFTNVRDDALFAMFVLMETGCRISEVANLTRADGVLDAEAPYIRVRPQRRRELKVAHTKRTIPLVGVALEAMRRAPAGFPAFRDRSDRLSAYLNTALRERDLLPSEGHKLSSFRHAFEKRMLEAGVDYGLRCELMGHRNDRPKYGDGGSMAFRRDQLLKIAHPYPAEMFAGG